MKKLPIVTTAPVWAFIFFSSCSVMKHTSQPSAVSSPPCHFFAGRLNISWFSIYDSKGLNLPLKEGSDSLPKNFTAYKINTPSLNSYLQTLDNIPYDQRVISMPVNGGNGCITFHLEPSGVMPEALQKKYPDIKSFKGTTSSDPNAQLRLDFDGETIRAEITHDNKVEFITPWKGNDGTLYYLLYNESDISGSTTPFKSY